MRSETRKKIFFRPQAFYWRRAIRKAAEGGDVKWLEEMANDLVDELVEHKAEFRRIGLMPPKGIYAPGEHEEKVGRS